MDTFPTSPSAELVWTRSKEKSHSYALGDGSGEYAFLAWPKALSHRAEGAWSGGRIVIERKGILHSMVTVIDEAFEQEIARMPWTWQAEAKLDFRDGRSFLMKKHGFWNDRWTFSEEDGTQIMELKPEGLLRTRGKLRIEGVERVRDQIPILAILIWYSYTVASQESAAVIGTAGRA